MSALPQLKTTAEQLKIVRAAGLMAGYTILHVADNFLLQSPVLNEIPAAYRSENRAWASRIAWIQDIGSALEFAYELFLQYGELTVITKATQLLATCHMTLSIPLKPDLENEATSLLLPESILMCCVGLESKCRNAP